MRSLTAFLLVLVAIAATFVAVPAAWAKNTVLDRAEFMTLMEPLGRDPAVQDAMAQEISQQVQRLLTEQGDARPPLDAITPYVSTYVHGPQFPGAFTEAVGQVRGSLSVGVIPTVTAVSVPDIIAAFHASHPHVDLTVRGGGSNEFMRDLGSGRLDVAFLGVAADVAPLRRENRDADRAPCCADVAAGRRAGARVPDTTSAAACVCEDGVNVAGVPVTSAHACVCEDGARVPTCAST